MKKTTYLENFGFISSIGTKVCTFKAKILHIICTFQKKQALTIVVQANFDLRNTNSLGWIKSSKNFICQKWKIFGHADSDYKVHIFWEGYKILRNLPLTFECSTHSQK